MEYEEALLIGGSRDGERVRTYPGQSSIKMAPMAAALGRIQDAAWRDEVAHMDTYLLHRVHDSSGFHRLIGLLSADRRGPMQALYEGYKKEKENA